MVAISWTYVLATKVYNFPTSTQASGVWVAKFFGVNDHEKRPVESQIPDYLEGEGPWSPEVIRTQES